MKLAVVGTGIGGMVVAARLGRDHDVTVYEANDYIGGHTHTVDVELHGRHYAIDTGFIVFNDWTYPSFIRLLEELGVESQPSNMSFSLRCERTGLEYNGTSLNALFAQRRNFFSAGFLRMIADILRFNATSPRLLEPGGDSPDDSLTLADYLRRGRYSREFVERYIVPMGKAIWSASERTMLAFPARFFVDFFARHGFLSVNDRPQWRAIKGGSREYVKRLVAPIRHRVRLRTPVAGVRRDAQSVAIRTARGDVERFDYVFFACHADQALAMLEEPTAAELEVLGAFPYQKNEAALHTDVSMLPRSPLARAAWNYHALAREQDEVAVTYDMNILQTLTAPEVFMVTLNRTADLDPKRVLRTITYDHPVYTPAAVRAQARRAEVSGVNRSFYCGAYWRFGFHEDGVVSANWALADFARVAGAAASEAVAALPAVATSPAIEARA
jgi:predicted NAD/FAD-binding protein